MIKDILKNTQNMLTPIKLLRYVDEDWGQLNMEMPPVQYPCALIGVGDITFTQVGDFAQKGVGTIIITVADTKLSNSSMMSAEEQEENGFAFYDVIQEVYRVLHLQEIIPNSEPLERAFVRKKERIDGTREYQVGFLLKFKEENDNS